MKYSAFYLSIFSLIVAPASSVVIAPSEGDCWGSTFSIISAEIVSESQLYSQRPLPVGLVEVVVVASSLSLLTIIILVQPLLIVFQISEIFCFSQVAVYNVALHDIQRTYILCEGTITVGDLPAGALSPIGGDYPIIVFNPNLHIKCEIHGSCILDGGTHGEELVINSEDSSLVAAFLASSDLPPPPEDYRVDSSNLLIEGVVFSGAGAANTDAPIELPGPGLNMVFDSCTWSANDHVNPPQSIIYMQFVDPTGIVGEGLYQSLTIKDSIIQDNTFTYSFVRTSWSGVQPPAGIVNEIIFDRTVFIHNVIEGDIRGGGFSQRPSLFTLFSTRLVLLNTYIATNAIGRFNGFFNLENGAEIIVSGEDTLLADIVASEPLNPSCGGAVIWNVTSDTNLDCACSENVTYSEVGCLTLEEIFGGSPMPTPAATLAPTPAPTLAPTPAATLAPPATLAPTLGTAIVVPAPTPAPTRPFGGSAGVHNMMTMGMNMGQMMMGMKRLGRRRLPAIRDKAHVARVRGGAR